jgi:hypothetical protein
VASSTIPFPPQSTGGREMSLLNKSFKTISNLEKKMNSAMSVIVSGVTCRGEENGCL